MVLTMASKKNEIGTASERFEQALANLGSLAEVFYNQLDKGQIPEMELPTRTKSNIEFDKKTRVWRYLRPEKFGRL